MKDLRIIFQRLLDLRIHSVKELLPPRLLPEVLEEAHFVLVPDLSDHVFAHDLALLELQVANAIQVADLLALGFFLEFAASSRLANRLPC